ncbi:hypothetical protein BKA66DRAFT_439497 [Pyrenochaeta sp. MPI-SDFR-AT-0127]|nr:hypothetical protein BKA66DRAFT_439497 [Pyrenochaeta sp. MPI-SDFR-AT-0127]
MFSFFKGKWRPNASGDQSEASSQYNGNDRTDTPQIEEGRSGFKLAAAFRHSNNVISRPLAAAIRIPTPVQQPISQQHLGDVPPIARQFGTTFGTALDSKSNGSEQTPVTETPPSQIAVSHESHFLDYMIHGALSSSPTTSASTTICGQPSRREGECNSSNQLPQAPTAVHPPPTRPEDQRQVISDVLTSELNNTDQKSTPTPIKPHHLEQLSTAVAFANAVAHVHDVDKRLDTILSAEDQNSTPLVSAGGSRLYGNDERQEERNIFAALKNAPAPAGVPKHRQTAKIFNLSDLDAPTSASSTVLRTEKSPITSSPAYLTSPNAEQVLDTITQVPKVVDERVFSRRPKNCPFIKRPNGSYWGEVGLDGGDRQPLKDTAESKTVSPILNKSKTSSDDVLKSPTMKKAIVEDAHTYPRRMKRYPTPKSGEGAVLGPIEYYTEKEEEEDEAAPGSKTNFADILEELEKKRAALHLKQDGKTPKDHSSAITKTKDTKKTKEKTSSQSSFTWQQVLILLFPFGYCTSDFILTFVSRTTGHAYHTASSNMTNATLNALDNTGHATFAATSPTSGAIHLAPIYNLSLSASQKEDICVHGTEVYWELKHETFIEGLENLGPQGPTFRAIKVPSFYELFIFVVMIIGIYLIFSSLLKWILGKVDGLLGRRGFGISHLASRSKIITKALLKRRSLASVLVGAALTALLVSDIIWRNLQVDG